MLKDNLVQGLEIEIFPVQLYSETQDQRTLHQAWRMLGWGFWSIGILQARFQLLFY